MTTDSQPSESRTIRVLPDSRHNVVYIVAFWLPFLFFTGVAVLSHPWTRGPGQWIPWLAISIFFAGAPLIAFVQVLWANDDSVGVTFAFGTRHGPRARLASVVGDFGRLEFLDRHGRRLFKTLGRPWADSQVEAFCRELGIEFKRRPRGSWAP